MQEFENQKVIITGVTSFIGCHLAKKFAEAGAQVVATTTQDLSDYKDIQGKRIVELQDYVEFRVLDLTSREKLAEFVEEHKDLNLWIHHAGYAANYGSLDYDVNIGHKVNVEPLYDLYPLLKNTNCTGVLVTGSSAEYSDTEGACFETDLCEPTMPYGLSKLTETLAALQLAKRYDLPTRIVRVFIPFGKLDAEKKLMPYVAKALSQNESVDLSPCTQKRDFIHIDDLVLGYQLLAKDLQNGGAQVYNLCSGVGVELKDLLIEFANALSVSPDLLKFGARDMRPGEAPESFGSNEKAMQVLNWKPKTLKESVNQYLKDLNLL